MKIQVQRYSFINKDPKNKTKGKNTRLVHKANTEKQQTILQQQGLPEQRYIYMVTNETNDIQLETMKPDRPSKG